MNDDRIDLGTFHLSSDPRTTQKWIPVYIDGPLPSDRRHQIGHGRVFIDGNGEPYIDMIIEPAQPATPPPTDAYGGVDRSTRESAPGSSTTKSDPA